MPRFRQMAAEAGRDPQSLPVTTGCAPEDLAQLQRFRNLGAAQVNVSLPAEEADKILPVLDRWAGLIRQLAGSAILRGCSSRTSAIPRCPQPRNLRRRQEITELTSSFA
ncbi:MAG: hypothetical protein JSS43_19210 [Proteobacteria bacterium]|nr:hypothetical protein [Pseudomonadota bacterium]